MVLHLSLSWSIQHKRQIRVSINNQWIFELCASCAEKLVIAKLLQYVMIRLSSLESAIHKYDVRQIAQSFISFLHVMLGNLQSTA